MNIFGRVFIVIFFLKDNYLKLLCINILTITIKIIMCPRGEIGRHKGLKILALLGVPVRVWPRAPLEYEKITFYF